MTFFWAMLEPIPHIWRFQPTFPPTYAVNRARETVKLFQPLYKLYDYLIKSPFLIWWHSDGLGNSSLKRHMIFKRSLINRWFCHFCWNGCLHWSFIWTRALFYSFIFSCFLKRRKTVSDKEPSTKDVRTKSRNINSTFPLVRKMFALAPMYFAPKCAYVCIWKPPYRTGQTPLTANVIYKQHLNVALTLKFKD